MTYGGWSKGGLKTFAFIFTQNLRMSVNKEAYLNLCRELENNHVTLVAVSKTKPVEDIMDLYNLGQRDFGENYVQEIVEKQAVLPKDIRWHFIGHLQRNKVKNIASFVSLIHGVDSFKLLMEINRQAAKQNLVSNCLLQVHIAEEETKFGLNEAELKAAIEQLGGEETNNVRIMGLMGMASFSEDAIKITNEFKYLKLLFDKYRMLPKKQELTTLSMGMSGDYKTAVNEGSNMVRIGSLLFGSR